MFVVIFLQEVTGGKGPDVILEMIASVNLQKDLEVIADFGRIVVCTISLKHVFATMKK